MYIDECVVIEISVKGINKVIEKFLQKVDIYE